jgi:hypothetical protein
MHYVGVTFILRHRFEITKHDRSIWALWNKFSKLRIQPNLTLYTFAEVVNVDRPSPATNSRARRPPGRCDRTGSMHRPPHRRTHPRSSVVSPEKPRARFGTRGSAARASHRIAAAALPDQETRADRAPVFIRRCSFRPSPRIFLEGTTFAASHRNESVMRRIPRDRRASRTPRPLPRVALQRVAALVPQIRHTPPRSRTRSNSNHCSISFAPPSAAHKTCRGQRARACACACACACA